MHIYLIDFENVNEHGLSGMDRLTLGDRVILFFTKNAGKVSLGVFNGISVGFTGIEVPGGKQSLDMHLITYLGYLLGKETDPTTRYYIVSNDTDYVKSAAFLNKLAGSERISIITAIDGPSMAVAQELRSLDAQEEGQPRNRRNRGRRRGGRYDRERSSRQEESEETIGGQAEMAETEPVSQVTEAAGTDHTAAVEASVEETLPTAEPEAAEVMAEPAAQAERPKRNRNRNGRNRDRRRRQEQTAGEKEAADAAFEEPMQAVENTESSEETLQNNLPEMVEVQAPENTEEAAAVQEQAEALKPQGRRGRTANARRKKAEPQPEAAADSAEPEVEAIPEPAAAEVVENPVLVRMLSLGEAEEKAQAVAAIVEAQPEDKAKKQLAYRAIVKAYGQKEGLRLYNLIKKVL